MNIKQNQGAGKIMYTDDNEAYRYVCCNQGANVNGTSIQCDGIEGKECISWVHDECLDQSDHEDFNSNNYDDFKWHCPFHRILNKLNKKRKIQDTITGPGYKKRKIQQEIEPQEMDKILSFIETDEDTSDDSDFEILNSKHDLNMENISYHLNTQRNTAYDADSEEEKASETDYKPNTNNNHYEQSMEVDDTLLSEHNDDSVAPSFSPCLKPTEPTSIRDHNEVFGHKVNLGKAEYIKNHHQFTEFRHSEEGNMLFAWQRKHVHQEYITRHIFYWDKCTNATKSLIKKRFSKKGINFDYAKNSINTEWQTLDEITALYDDKANNNNCNINLKKKQHRYDIHRKSAFTFAAAPTPKIDQEYSIYPLKKGNGVTTAIGSGNRCSEHSILKYQTDPIQAQLVCEHWCQSRLISTQALGGKDDKKIKTYPLPTDPEDLLFYFIWIVASLLLLQHQNEYNVSFVPEGWKSATVHNRISQIYNILLKLERIDSIAPINKEMSERIYRKLVKGFGLSQKDKNNEFNVVVTALWGAANSEFSTGNMYMNDTEDILYDDFNQISMSAACKKIKDLKRKNSNKQFGMQQMMAKLLEPLNQMIAVDNLRFMNEMKQNGSRKLGETEFNHDLEEKVFNYALERLDQIKFQK